MDIETGCRKENDQGTRGLKTVNRSWEHKLYAAATEDDDEFEELLERVSIEEMLSQSEILSRVRPLGNTLLHIAIKFGRQRITRLLVERDPSIIYRRNLKGDTALHVAAKHGHENIAADLIQYAENGGRKYNRDGLLERLVDETKLLRRQLLEILEEQETKSLFEAALFGEETRNHSISGGEPLQKLRCGQMKSESPSPLQIQPEREEKVKALKASLAMVQNENKIPLAMFQNIKGNAALHEALIFRKKEMALFLIGSDPKAWFLLNKQEKSPFYLAVEAGLKRCR